MERRPNIIGRLATSQIKITIDLPEGAKTEKPSLPSKTLTRSTHLPVHTMGDAAAAIGSAV